MTYQLRKPGAHVDILSDDHSEVLELIAKGWFVVRMIGKLQ